MMAHIRAFFKKMFNSGSNSKCADCRACKAKYASLTFGVFLCEGCANQHKTLLTNDYIKNLKKDEWTNDEIQIFLDVNGGNDNFLEFMRKYDLADRDISTKYKSYPAEYYSKSLACKMTGLTFSMAEPLSDWREQ